MQKKLCGIYIAVTALHLNKFKSEIKMKHKNQDLDID